MPAFFPLCTFFKPFLQHDCPGFIKLLCKAAEVQPHKGSQQSLLQPHLCTAGWGDRRTATIPVHNSRDRALVLEHNSQHWGRKPSTAPSQRGDGSHEQGIRSFLCPIAMAKFYFFTRLYIVAAHEYFSPRSEKVSAFFQNYSPF